MRATRSLFEGHYIRETKNSKISQTQEPHHFVSECVNYFCDLSACFVRGMSEPPRGEGAVVRDAPATAPPVVEGTVEPSYKRKKYTYVKHVLMCNASPRRMFLRVCVCVFYAPQRTWYI